MGIQQRVTTITTAWWDGPTPCPACGDGRVHDQLEPGETPDPELALGACRCGEVVWPLAVTGPHAADEVIRLVCNAASAIRDRLNVLLDERLGEAKLRVEQGETETLPPDVVLNRCGDALVLRAYATAPLIVSSDEVACRVTRVVLDG